jgi:hypothetical protein
MAGACPIESFRAYVTKAAHHACDGFFRRRFPRRHCLKNRLRYVLRDDRRFAVWPDTNGTTVCGRFGWAGRTAGEFPALSAAVLPSAPIETALEAVFDAVGGPVELDDVTGFLAAAWGLRGFLLERQEREPRTRGSGRSAIAKWWRWAAWRPQSAWC